MKTVLVCDDDEAILESLRIYLDNAGYNVITAVDGMDALEKVIKNEIHCVVLDIMMPKLDGLKTTLKIREKYNFPIILLSAKSEDTDKIAGLGFGADDYVTKPFNPLELVARVNSQIRRYVTLGSLVIKESQLVTGGIVLDKDTKSVTVDGDEVRLTAMEYKILEHLMSNMGKVLSSSQIYEAVWNEPSYSSEKTVTVHIRNLREKIEINPKEPKYIKVVYGLGYKCEKI
ncbi:MAG: response regulator transcription factor [Acetobacter sp.]|nr:response regulator transcription factor [Bacteroides sp.]MCM1341023.1 response regulator transcription factor [Acetobacter sp.]MCM1432421.1 response regulator transcription factor [Clostridiales bacterium]